MAKDKDKGKKKAAAVDDFVMPSDAPAGGGWALSTDENDGKLFLVTPLRKQEVATERYGDKEVIVADVVEIDEDTPADSELHEDVFIFGAWLQGTLRSYIGKRRMLVRLVKTPDSSSGRGYVWKFEDGDEDDVAAARAYLASLDPFTVSQ